MIMTLYGGSTYGNLILTGWLGHPPWIPNAKMAALDLNWPSGESVTVTLAADYFPVGTPFVRESFRSGVPWKVRKGTPITVPRAEAAGLCTQFCSPATGAAAWASSGVVHGGDVHIANFSTSNSYMKWSPGVFPGIAGTPTFAVAHGINPTITITNPGFSNLLTGTPGTPPASAFTVYNGGPTPSPHTNVTPMPISSVTLNANTITLGLVGTINLGDVITLTYIPPAYMQSNSSPIQDLAGNLFPLVAAQQVVVS